MAYDRCGCVAEREQEGGKSINERINVSGNLTHSQNIFSECVDILDMHVHYISLPRAALFDFVRGSKNCKPPALTWQSKSTTEFQDGFVLPFCVHAHYFRLQHRAVSSDQK